MNKKVKFVQISMAGNNGGMALVALDDQGRIWTPKGNITFPFHESDWDMMVNPDEPDEKKS